MSNEIKQMFSKIADNYDKVNRIISLGADIRWRQRTAKECLDGLKSAKILDVATGTGDLAIALSNVAKMESKDVDIIGLDFNEDMLEIAKKKIKSSRIGNVKLVTGDALATKLSANEFDVITSGFALRNFDNLKDFLKESFRLLKPGGRIVFLDVAKPPASIGNVMQFYYFNVIPMIGAKYNKDAYVYLVSSLWKFDKRKLIQFAREVGFAHINLKNVTFGAAFIFSAKKPKGKKKQ